jgi:S1-C subfamily serine protease
MPFTVRSRQMLSAAALAGVLALAGCGGEEATPGQTRAAAPLPAAQVGRSIDSAVVAERVLPGVVNVRVEGLGGSGAGSGVVIDREGTILTNNHVVAGASEVTVVFNDGRHDEPLRGEVVGTAPERDLAVIRVDADDLTPVELGRSGELRLGDPVLALGFPLGLGPTVTQGIVSGLERAIEPSGGPRLEGLLQTDAAINPGNSGGALVDADGRLVGINTAGAGFAENIGFAIAIDQARPVVEEILGQPPEERAWLGVTIDSIESDAEAVAAGLDPEARGALVAGVYPGSPAEAAGLGPGDLITALAGADVGSAADLTRAVTELEPGEEVTAEVSDVQGERTVELRPAERPATLG